MPTFPAVLKEWGRRTAALVVLTTQVRRYVFSRSPINEKEKGKRKKEKKKKKKNLTNVNDKHENVVFISSYCVHIVRAKCKRNHWYLLLIS